MKMEDQLYKNFPGTICITLTLYLMTTSKTEVNNYWNQPSK